MRAVLFDMDGVLLDSKNAWLETINAVAQLWGYPPVTIAAFESSFGQGVDADIQQFFPRHSVEQLDEAYATEFPRHLDAVHVDPEAPAVLSILSAAEIRTAIVTNTPHDLTEEMVRAADLHPDVVLGTNVDRRAKPRPDLLHAALDRLGVAAADAVMLGDSRYDAEAARVAKVPFVGCRRKGEARLERLSELPALLGF